jgi:hypothetical protein
MNLELGLAVKCSKGWPSRPPSPSIPYASVRAPVSCANQETTGGSVLQAGAPKTTGGSVSGRCACRSRRGAHHAEPRRGAAPRGAGDSDCRALAGMCCSDRPEYTRNQNRAINTGIAQSIYGGIVRRHVPSSNARGDAWRSRARSAESSMHVTLLGISARRRSSSLVSACHTVLLAGLV